MKKDSQIATLTLLILIASFGIFSEVDEHCRYWFAIFILSKSIGVIAAYTAYRLCKYWRKTEAKKSLKKEI